jgi:hypothetical protein
MLSETRMQGVDIKVKIRDAKIRKITKSDMKSLRKLDKLPDDAPVDDYLKVGVIVNIDVKFQQDAQSETQNMIIYLKKQADKLYVRHLDGASSK